MGSLFVSNISTTAIRLAKWFRCDNHLAIRRLEAVLFANAIIAQA